MSNLNIRVSQMEGSAPVTVLHVSGEVDANSHQELDAKSAEITGAGASNVLLDLSDVSYMSSAGFRSMHKIHTALQGKGALKLLKPSDEVKRLLKTMGFDAHISSHEDMNEAINAF